MDKVERKVTKIGNSLGITLPVELLKSAGLSQGDNVQIEMNNGKIILQKKEEIHLPDGVDAEFTEILNDVIKEHDQAFRGLVDR